MQDQSLLTGYALSTDDISSEKSSTTRTAATFHRIIEAWKFAYAKRANLGDGSFVDNSEVYMFLWVTCISVVGRFLMRYRNYQGEKSSGHLKIHINLELHRSLVLMVYFFDHTAIVCPFQMADPAFICRTLSSVAQIGRSFIYIYMHCVICKYF